MIKIFQRWFNCPPHPNVPFITDQHGEKFWIYCSEWNSLSVWYRGSPSGRINLIWKENQEVTLADIEIFPQRLRNRDLHHRGLGKAMLQEAIRYIKERGGERITGRIQPHGPASKEYLIEWYRRQGFDAIEEDGKYFIEKCLE